MNEPWQIEPERYEFFEDPAFALELDRRDFFRVAGAGLLVALFLRGVPALAQRGGFGPPQPDDIGAWLTSTLDRHRAWENGSVAAPVRETIEAMVAAVSAFESTLVLVSPEVGLTVVPATASGRRFADELGSLNQRIAALCDQVVLVVAGQAVPIKPSGT